MCQHLAVPRKSSLSRSRVAVSGAWLRQLSPIIQRCQGRSQPRRRRWLLCLGRRRSTICALSTSNIGSVSHPSETGLLIPSGNAQIGNLGTSCSAPRDLVGLQEFQRDHNSRATYEPQCPPTPSEKILSRRCGLYHP